MTRQVSEQEIIQAARREEAIMQNQQTFLQNLKNALRETHETIEGLKEIQKKPQKVLFKIGTGVLVEAEIKNTEKCKRVFSENGYKEAKTEETIKWLENRKNNLEQQAQKVQADLYNTEQKLNAIINMARQIQEEKNKNISVK